MLPHLTPPAPGEGESWRRLSERVRTELPVEQLDGIWVFRPVRRDGQEFGTAILSRLDPGEGERRRRIYTACYCHQLKGKQRGAFEAGFEEVGSGPPEALDELLAMVPRRSDEEEPPTAVALELWFPPTLPEETQEDGAGGRGLGCEE